MSASMQPPDRKPDTTTDDSSIWAPAGRGPPPRTVYKVTRAAVAFAAAVARIAGRMSSARPNMGHSGRVGVMAGRLRCGASSEA